MISELQLWEDDPPPPWRRQHACESVSHTGVALQKGAKKGAFRTTMKGGAKALFEGVAGAAKEIPGARRQNLRHAVDDNRREKLREEVKEIDKDVLKYQKVDPKQRR